jgi:hypothetical protein
VSSCTSVVHGAHGPPDGSDLTIALKEFSCS